MPRLGPALANTVFFLYGRDSLTCDISGPQGTGVFIARPREMQGEGLPYLRHVYAVTCQHVSPDVATILRVNTPDGKSRFMEFEPHEWQFVGGGADIAAVDVTD